MVGGGVAVRACTIGTGAVDTLQQMGTSFTAPIMLNSEAHGQSNVMFQGNNVKA